jgi:hypothetical protein
LSDKYLYDKIKRRLDTYIKLFWSHPVFMNVLSRYFLSQKLRTTKYYIWMSYCVVLYFINTVSTHTPNALCNALKITHSILSLLS